MLKYEIILKFLFPKFSHPKESRFLNFFPVYQIKKDILNIQINYLFV